MKVFWITAAFGKSGNYVYRDIVPVRDKRTEPWEFDGTLKSGRWNAAIPAVRLMGGRRKRVADFLACTPGSAFAMVDLIGTDVARILHDCGEILPIASPIELPVSIVNIAPSVDALDVEMSEWRRYGDVTPYMELCKPAFDPARLPARSVFKIRENGWRIFASQGAVPASDDFKAAYEKQGLKGLEFHEVWNDDGDPVEIPEW